MSGNPVTRVLAAPDQGLSAIVLTTTAAASLMLVTAPLAALLSGLGWAHWIYDDPGNEILGLVQAGPSAVYEPAPPTWLFWALTVLVWTGAAYAAYRIRLRFARGRSVGGAQWGGARVERALSAPARPDLRPNRLTAGRGLHTKGIVAARPHISATVFGPPGSSKTTGLLLPNAAEWQGPLVLTTTKAADLDAIHARRSALGPVWLIAPAGIPGRTTHRWSPVDYCTDARAADRMAAWMAEASASGDDKRAAPWVDQARSILKGILLAAHLSGGGIDAMRRWIALGKDAVDHVRDVLVEHGQGDVADDYASPWLRLHDDGVGSIQFTLNVIARVYADEEVRRSASGTDFTVDRLLDECGTVCLIAGEADAERFAPLLTSLIASVIHGAEARYARTGTALDPALGILVDEAGNMLRYPRLPNILTTGRGMGIVLLTVWHDLSQLRDRLGTQKANTVLNASGLRMLLPGCADPETLRYFQTLLGRTEVLRTSLGRSSGSFSSNSSPAETDLAPIHSLQQLPEFTAVVQYANQPPVKVRMRLVFRDRDLRRLLGEAGRAAGRVSLNKQRGHAGQAAGRKEASRDAR
jgi:type IV secretory pathway TraG/TraD family ATPase VirD4